MMRIVFWQNILSPHQLPYIARLMDDERVDEVVVAAGQEMTSERKDMGWSVGNYPGLERCKIFVRPDDATINSLLAARTEDSWHLFSGIHADPFVFKCLETSMDYPPPRGMITERPNTYDFRLNIENARPLWMHRIRFRLQDRRYARKMQAVFAMGGQAVDYFKSVNKHWSVFPFCYCTQSNTIEAKDIEGATRFAFVGSIEPWKNPMGLLMAANELKKDEKFTLSIIGNGSLYAKASAFIGQNGLDDMVKMLGTQPQERIPELLSEADVLVLPSLYDGWGAVVNEALQAGCYVIVSDACGASSLLDGREGLGSVFNHHDTAALASQMALCCDRIGEIRSHRSYRRQWTEAHIGGSAVARYMVDCLSRIRG